MRQCLSTGTSFTLYNEAVNRNIRGFNVGEDLHSSLLTYGTVRSRKVVVNRD
jgi:hypothetical protein